jgi:PST family polysaccharide transporter
MYSTIVKNKKIVFNIFNRIGFLTAGKLIGFITLPLITRALGPENYGIYNYVMTIASYAFLLANWGFLAKGIRDIAKKPKNSEKVVEFITSGRIILWFIGGIVGLIICLLLFGFTEMVFLIFIAIMANFGLALTIDYNFYALKNTFLPSLSLFISQILFLILVFLFIDDQEDLKFVLLFNLIYRLFEALFLIYFYKLNKTFKLTFSLKKTYNLISENFSLGLGSKASFFQSSFPILIIPFFLSQYHLGVFTAAFKFFLILSLVLQTINLVISPWIVEAREKNIKSQRSLFIKLFYGYLLIGLISTVIIYLTGEFFIILLFGNEFLQSVTILKYFAICLLPIWPSYMILASYMNNLEKDRAYLYGSLITLVIIVTMVPVGLMFFGLKGVVFAMSFSTFVVSVYFFIIVKKTIITND